MSSNEPISRHDGPESAERLRFQKLANAMPVIVWTATPDGNVDFSSRRFYEYTGVDEKTPVPDHWQKTLHPEDMPRCLETWMECVRTHSDFDIEYRIANRQGDYRWFRVQASPIFDENGSLTAWYGSGMDIHDLKTMERENSAVAERLTDILESITDGFMILDTDEKITYANREAERLMERSDLPGNVFWEVLPGSPDNALRESVQQALKKKYPQEAIQFFALSEKWIKFHIYPTQEGLALNLIDITQQQKQEKWLNLQQVALEVAADGMVITDREGEIIWANAAYTRQYGYSLGEIIGKKIGSIEKSGLQDEAFYDHLWKTILDGRVWTGELVNRRRDGSLLTEELTITPLTDPGGEITHFIGIKRDITERKKNEQQMLRSQRIESIGNLAGGLAHDLNNVLAPILLAVESLKTDESDPEKLEMLRNMEASAQHGAELISRILSFARGSDARPVLLDLRTTLDELQRILKNTFPRSIRIKINPASDLWPVEADPTQMQQLMMNLCVNARDAMPEGGDLHISLENIVVDDTYQAMNINASEGPYVLIEISDTGSGIPLEQQNAIFDPFFTTKEHGKGTGLGLATVMSIVRSSGGFLNLYSEQGKGTRFKIYVPARTDKKSVESRAVAQTALPRGKGETLLIVDDETSIREITRKTLERFGYKILTAANGAEGVSVFSENKKNIDLVLTDIAMPVMDGAAMILALRTIAPDLRIIASSGHDSNGGMTKALNQKIDHFIAKPYTAETLLNTIRRILDEASEKA